MCASSALGEGVGECLICVVGCRRRATIVKQHQLLDGGSRHICPRASKVGGLASAFKRPGHVARPAGHARVVVVGVVINFKDGRKTKGVRERIYVANTHGTQKPTSTNRTHCSVTDKSIFAWQNQQLFARRAHRSRHIGAALPFSGPSDKDLTKQIPTTLKTKGLRCHLHKHTAKKHKQH